MESPISENFKRIVGSECVDTEEKEATDNHLAHAVNLVTSNYIIVRQIIQNLSWRDIKMASSVCKLWNEVATNLLKTHLAPQLFHSRFIRQETDRFIDFKIDKEPINEPMLILAFWKRLGKPKIVNVGNNEIYYKYNNSFEPKMVKFSNSSNAFVGVACERVIHPSVKSGLPDIKSEAFVGGLYFPRIEGVRIHNLCQRMAEMNDASNEMSSISEDLSRIMETEHIKCLLIFLCKDFGSKHERIITNVIAEVKARQGKEYPFAVGGCTAYETQFGKFYKRTNYRIVKIVAIGVDKKIPDSSLNFDIFSKVISLSNDSQDTIAANITEMSESIPTRKYSAAVKLTGNYRSLDFEETVFKEHFPDTKTIGCFGCEQIGLDHLPRKVLLDGTKDNDTNAEKGKKLQKHEPFYKDSSVMVLFSWGNLK